MTEIESKIKNAVSLGNREERDSAISELLNAEDISNHIGILNDLLLVTYHHQHQYLARAIQDLESPSSVPFIKKVLESKFENIPYTGSDSDAMAKWFSWSLYCIGTEEAIEVIKEQANSEDNGIREEMCYRLKKLKSAEKI